MRPRERCSVASDPESDGRRTSRETRSIGFFPAVWLASHSPWMANASVRNQVLDAVPWIKMVLDDCAWRVAVESESREREGMQVTTRSVETKRC